jgi:hypothetical protein
MRLLTMAVLASMAIAPLALGCPFCAGDASGSNPVRDGIFNSDFWLRAAATLAPFPIFAAVVAFIYFGPQRLGASEPIGKGRGPESLSPFENPKPS